MNLLFFDIDGTLAIGRDVPASAAKALELTRAKGNKVFICTGRALPYARRFFSAYADGFVCYNGRLGVMDDQVLYDHPLTHEQIVALVAKLRDNDAAFEFFGTEHGYFEGSDEQFEDAKKAWYEGFLVKEFDEHAIKAYNFDLLYKDKDHFKHLREVLKDECILNDHFPHPSADVTIIGHDKATAMTHIAEKLGVPLDHVYAFGDGYNDIKMIKAAGVGIALGNAVDDLKEVADYITTPITEDGVYNAMKHFELI